MRLAYRRSDRPTDPAGPILLGVGGDGLLSPATQLVELDFVVLTNLLDSWRIELAKFLTRAASWGCRCFSLSIISDRKGWGEISGRRCDGSPAK